MKFIAMSAVSFNAGAVLGLSRDQAISRAPFLALIEGRKGWYQATGSLQFKAGEEFHFDGDLPKAMAERLESALKVKLRPKSKAEMDAETAEAAAQREAKAKADAEIAAQRVAADKAEAAAQREAKAQSDAKIAAQRDADDKAAAQRGIESDAGAEGKQG